MGNYLAGLNCEAKSCQKVCCSNRSKYFFLCVNRGTTGKIFKTCVGLSEQVLMDEPSYSLVFKFRGTVVLSLSPLNSKYLENYKSISCRVRRKYLGKVHVRLQKLAKLV